MIFAAGLGTRLRPYTNDRPKALVEIGGEALLGHLIQKLKRMGIREVVVNVHHFADQVIQYLRTHEDFGINIHISDERDLLLDTGGGLKHAAPFFADGAPFLVHNVDVLTDIDLPALENAHLNAQALATLAVRDRKTSRYLLVEPESNRLAGWQNIQTGEVRPSSLNPEGLQLRAFSGIHIIDPRLMGKMIETGVFSIIDVYLRLAETQHIHTFDHSDSIWMDVGKAAGLPDAEALLLELAKNEE